MAYDAMPGDPSIQFNAYSATTSYMKGPAGYQQQIPKVFSYATPALTTTSASNTPTEIAWTTISGSASIGYVIAVGPLLGLAAGPPPGPPRQKTWTYQFPKTTSGGGHFLGYNTAQFAAQMTLVLQKNGDFVFGGDYWNESSEPIFSGPSESFTCTIVVTASNELPFTFEVSHNNIPTGGTLYTWLKSGHNSLITTWWSQIYNNHGVVPECSDSSGGPLAFVSTIWDDLKDVYNALLPAIAIVGLAFA
jgi:hypothetical protein